MKRLKVRPDNNVYLELCGLFKRSIVGNVNVDSPIFSRGAEWDAWHRKQGMSPNKAAQEFVFIVEVLVKRFGLT